jgi:hypothetical protein
MVETRHAAEAAFDHFVDAYGAKYDKAAACLVKDRTLLALLVIRNRCARLHVSRATNTIFQGGQR